jgi:hypothetical protein
MLILALCEDLCTWPLQSSFPSIIRMTATLIFLTRYFFESNSPFWLLTCSCQTVRMSITFTRSVHTACSNHIPVKCRSTILHRVQKPSL